jgi:hypothetical protein
MPRQADKEGRMTRFHLFLREWMRVLFVENPGKTAFFVWLPAIAAIVRWCVTR